MIEIYEFKKIEELLDYISPWGENPNLDGYVFRGHSQESYKLLPTALRLESVDWFWSVCGLGKPIEQQYHWQTWQVKAEYQLLRSFYRLADQRGLEVPISSRVRANLAQEFDTTGMLNIHSDEKWLSDDLLETAALAQHYGIPTRLLDWTYDIYVALYFAFRGAVKKDNNLTIWAINKEYLSFLKPTVNRVNVEFITPHYAGNPNLNAQKGLFTHWPIIIPSTISEMQDMQRGRVTLVDRRPLDELIYEQIGANEHSVNMMKKFILPCSEAVKGCVLLDKLGYDSARIFPGYDGVAKQLLSRHKYS
ncbi:TPA: FRG domain-containing protein [Vibrio cholerae]